MMFDSQDASQVLNNGSAFEPMDPRQAPKKTLRGKGGALLTSSALIAAATALTISGEAVAQGVPSGFAPAPSDVVSYVQLSNGSVLVQLANQQSLLVTSNNFFIDGSGVLYLSPSVSAGISGGGPVLRCASRVVGEPRRLRAAGRRSRLARVLRARRARTRRWT